MIINFTSEGKQTNAGVERELHWLIDIKERKVFCRFATCWQRGSIIVN
jgi:hypothetical protein